MWSFRGEISMPPSTSPALGITRSWRLYLACTDPLSLTRRRTGSMSLLIVHSPHSGSELSRKIVRARKVNELGASIDSPETSWLAAVDVILELSMPSENHSVEWGCGPSRDYSNA